MKYIKFWPDIESWDLYIKNPSRFFSYILSLQRYAEKRSKKAEFSVFFLYWNSPQVRPEDHSRQGVTKVQCIRAKSQRLSWLRCLLTLDLKVLRSYSSGKLSRGSSFQSFEALGMKLSAWKLQRVRGTVKKWGWDLLDMANLVLTRKVRSNGTAEWSSSEHFPYTYL